MSNGFYNVPIAVNEPVKGYAVGSPERIELLAEYKKMYNKYNSDKVLVLPHPLENLLYFFFFNLRHILKKYAPNLYKRMINFIRRCNGSYNLLK